MARKHIVFSAIAMVIAGLMITSAAGFGMIYRPEPMTVEETSAREVQEIKAEYYTAEEIQKQKLEKIENALLECIKVSTKKAASMPAETVETIIEASLQPVAFQYKHPAIAQEGDYLVLGYEYYDNDAFTEELIIEAVNYSADPTDVYAFYYPDDNVEETAKYPSADYWGADDRFYVTYCMRNDSVSDGAPLNIRIDHPGDPNNGTEIVHRSWGFYNNGWQNLVSDEIACDHTVEFPWNKTAAQPWGVTSWIGGISPDNPPGYPDGEGIPFLQYPVEIKNMAGNDDGIYSVMSWYYVEDAGGGDAMITGCVHDSAYIDPLGTNPDDIPVEGDGISIAYQVYDWPGIVDPGDPEQWHLGFRWTESEYDVDYWNPNAPDDQLYPIADGGLGLWAYLDETLHMKNPVVAAYDDTIVVVIEAYGFNEGDPDDSDIICFYTDTGNFSDHEASVIAASSAVETNPDIQHIEGDKFQVSFEYEDPTSGDATTYMSKTSNGGAAWGLWYYWPDFEDLSTEDYRHADYSEVVDDLMIIAMEWENTSGDPTNVDLFLGNATIISNLPPIDPLAGYPEDAETGVSPNLDEYGEYGYLIWFGGDPDGDTITYDVFFDDVTPPVTLIATVVDQEYVNMSDQIVQPMPLDDYTTYYWKVVATDKDGTNTSEIFSFETGEVRICGDANGDGVLNVSDAVFIINYVFIPGSPVPDPLCYGDVNGDGFVNVSDAVYIINYVFIPGSLPPVTDCC